VGAPSGWSSAVCSKYEDLLRSAGLSQVEVKPESRGALLFARDSGEVVMENGQFRGKILIVDIGSSTTDYTRVVDLRSARRPRQHQVGCRAD
jgi:molecular chaperone DnaK (HSP70)